MLFFLLFIPEEVGLKQAQAIVQEICESPEYQGYEKKFKGDIPIFLPHVTIMGLEGINLAAVQQGVERALKNQQAVTLKVDAIKTTDYYFRSVFVFYQENEVVTDLISRLKTSFQGKPDLVIKSSNEHYLHMSLAYTSATMEQKNKIAKAPFKSQGGKTLDEIYPRNTTTVLNKVIVITTEESESPAGVRNWTVEGEYKLNS
jgi:hypothetical protein